MPQFSADKSTETMIVTGGSLITPCQERYAQLRLEGQLIIGVTAQRPGRAACEEPDAEPVIVDADGCYVTPGLIDLQVNGGPECDLWADPEAGSLLSLRRTMARCGVTSFLPTLITDDPVHMKANIARLVANGVGEELALLDSVRQTEAPRRNSRIPERQEAAARMPGIHLEGPFLSPERPGVHPPQHIRPLSEQAAADLVQDAVRLMTVAPEQDESGQAIAYLQKHGVRVSLGHSNANFAEAQQAFDRGVRLMTHTFNALPPVQHRAPGAVTAALLDERVYCCVIADGLHLDPEIVRLIYKIKGPSKTILVTDRAHVGTSQGGLVGSSLTLEQAVRNVVKWGIASFADAITMATVTPAAALGLDFALGHLSPGKLADFVVWDANTLEIKQVAVGGRLVF